MSSPGHHGLTFPAGWTIARIGAEQAERDRPWDLDGDKE